MATEVRIEVPQSVRKILDLEQERRKKINGKKTAISDILLEYCCKWIYHKDSFEEGAVVPSISGQDNNSMALHNQTPTTTGILLKEKNLLQKESELREKEIYLSRRQSEMDNEKMEFYDKKEDLIRIKAESLEYMNRANELFNKNAHNVWLIERLEKDSIEKKNLIYKKDKEIDSLKKEVLKSLKIIEDNTKKNIFKDYILPALPTIVNILGLYVINKKITKIEELKPMIADMSQNIKTGNLENITDIEKALGN